MIYLALFASREKKAGIKEIAEKLDIPTPFLGKILQQLARNNLLHSTKGPRGGFNLNKPAMDISVMDVINVIDSSQAFDTCVIRTSACSMDSPCSMHAKVAPLRGEMKRIFETETIADLASEFRQGKEKIRI